MSAPSRQLALAAGAGLALGLSLPHIVRLLRRSRDAAGGDESTHAVRAGLEEDSVRLPRKTLEELLTAILVKAGAASAHAAQAAEVLAFADVRGIPSHGANRADLYANEIAAGLVDGKAVPVVERSSGCCAVIDGRNALGAVVSHLAMNTALDLAREHGVALVVARRSNHYGAAGFWANLAMNEGMIGMSFTNTTPLAAATGGRTRALGTNPFCCFAPALDGDSFQLDMATTVVPIGKVEVMHRIGKSVPTGWGVDRLGQTCTSPEEIVRFGALYPLGGAAETAGYKGYGLGMWIEMMSSVLSGAATGPDVQPWVVSRKGPIDFGHAFIVIDPSRFTPGYTERLQQYIHAMRGLPGSVKVPGDPEREHERDAEARGVVLHRDVATALKALAERFGLAAPPALAALDAGASKSSLYAH